MSNTSQHACFYMDTVTFCVEDCLFKVPRGPFESESSVFRDMFLLPTGPGAEGRSDDNPIHLAGIKKDEFESLLSALFYRVYGTSQKPLPQTSDQWTSVLKLTRLWGFDTICKAAISRLGEILPATEKIVLGEAYDLDFESWILPAMNEIMQRPEPISIGEGQRMGLEMALKLASVREQVTYNKRWVVGTRPNAGLLDFKSTLRNTFKPQIQADDPREVDF